LASVDHAAYICHSLPHKDKKGIWAWRALLCVPVDLPKHSYPHSDSRPHASSTEEMMGWIEAGHGLPVGPYCFKL